MVASALPPAPRFPRTIQRDHVLVNIDPLYDKEGVLVGAVNCFQDIGDLTGSTT